MDEAYSIGTGSVVNGGPLGNSCIDCGYSLDGLQDRGICPECGSDYGNQLTVTGYTNHGGPLSPMLSGGVFLLIGLSDVILSPLTVGWMSFLNPCSIVGLILVGAGFLAANQVRRHGGNLRWVLGNKGLYTIRGSRKVLKTVQWSGIYRFSAPWVVPWLPGGWRMLKVHRRWHSWDILRRRSPVLWLKGVTRREARGIAERCNEILKQRDDLIAR